MSPVIHWELYQNAKETFIKRYIVERTKKAEFTKSPRAVESREKCRKLVVKSSVVPQ